MSPTLERGALLHKRYRIVEILGQGGMGSVYHAVDENLGVDVAVKENLFTTDEYARQFRLEAVLLANLRHPNLPRVTDHFVVGEQGQYLVMDFIEGEDLRQRMERTGSISEQEAILIGVAMCDALQFLHTRKPAIIHRDVKPGNVRIAPDGHVYLVDFGLAKLVRGGQATTTGARAMTPGYSPPEQYGAARTDSRTDIYSLGATLYAALTGVIPEDGLARAMDNIDLTPLRERNPRISRKLASTIEKGMAVRPEDRFQSADEFKQSLLSSIARNQRLEGEILVEPPPEGNESADLLKAGALNEPITEKNYPDLPPLSPHRRKNRGGGCWVFFSIFLLVVLAAVLAIVTFWSPISRALPGYLVRPSPTARERTASPTATETALPVVSLVTASSTPTVIKTPTLTWTPLPSDTQADTPTPSSTPTQTQVPSPEPTLLGGGSGQIAFASNRTGIPQIYVMNSDGGNQLQVTSLPDGACQPDWSPDGKQIVFISPCPGRLDQYPGSHLFTVNADGTGLTTLPASTAGDFDPAWSPDGGRLAFTSLRDGSPQIYLMKLSDGSVTSLTQTSSDNRFPEWSRQPKWSPDGTQIVYTVTRLGVLQIWTMDSSGSDQAQVVRRGSGFWDFLPHWSKDGKVIMFSETSGPQEFGRLMTLQTSGLPSSNPVPFLNVTLAADGELSPDGLWVVYEGTPDGKNHEIYCITSDGKNRTRLTTDANMDFNPTWRPAAAP